MADLVEEAEGGGGGEEKVDGEDEEIVAQPADLPVVSKQVEICDSCMENTCFL